jgi:regulator of Ty1 transposition protein 103
VDIQGKLRRVIEVWRQRNVFDVPVLDAIDARVNGKFLRISSKQLALGF